MELTHRFRGVLRIQIDTAILARYTQNDYDNEGLEEELASSLRWPFFSYRGAGGVAGNVKVFEFQQRRGR